MNVFKSLQGQPLPLGSYVGCTEKDLRCSLVDGYTVFEAAASGCFSPLAAFLIGGLDPNTVDDRGSSLLHLAAASGQELSIRFLLDNSANVDARDAGGMTPLMIACRVGNLQCAILLLESGASSAIKCNCDRSCAFYAVSHPMILHALFERGALSKATVSENELLHEACRNSGNRFSVLYLLENNLADPISRSKTGTGFTPLHCAALTGDLDLVKAVVSRGGDLTVTDSAGARPGGLPKCPGHVRRWISKYLGEQNSGKRLELTIPDFSNYASLSWKQFYHFFIAFFVPNIIAFIGTALPFPFSALSVVSVFAGFSYVASFGLKQKGRSLVTAGWYIGAICFGMLVLHLRVFPLYLEQNPDTLTVPVMEVLLLLMVFAYLKAALADPGCVQSTPDHRREIFRSYANAAQMDAFDITAMVRKPMRSKHCTKTHQCVKRFDHYCVWTGNAIGGGNHRPFIAFCLIQFICHLFVVYFSVFFYTTSVPSNDMGMSDWLLWLVTGPNLLTSLYLIMYNTFVLLFVLVMLLQQLWFISRNVTSNEVWFPDRYKWMMRIGSRAYCLYDMGVIRNFTDFIRGVNLLREDYDIPAMSDHLKQVCKAYTSKFPKAPEASASSSVPVQESAQAQQVSQLIKSLPDEKQNEIAAVQRAFGQMLQGVEPQVDTVPADRVAAVLQQARTMHDMYQKRMTDLRGAPAK